MKVLVLGASDNPERYSFKAVNMLMDHGHEVFPVGIRKGVINGIPIIHSKEIQEEIHTVTLYVGVNNQTPWYDYILQTKPERIIFNPGTENDELMELAAAKGIKTEEACTLVLLTTGTF